MASKQSGVGGIHVAKGLRAVTPMESIARGKFGGGGNWT